MLIVLVLRHEKPNSELQVIDTQDALLFLTNSKKSVFHTINLSALSYGPVTGINVKLGLI